MTAMTCSKWTGHHRILCVEENAFALYANATVLSYEGYEAQTCSDPMEAVVIVRSQDIDVVVVDYHMSGMNGAELAAYCKAVNPKTKVILFSEVTGIPKRELALADLFVAKTDEIQALLDGMRMLLSRGRIDAQFDFRQFAAAAA